MCLSEFLLARIAEDEQGARDAAADQGTWVTNTPKYHSGYVDAGKLSIVVDRGSEDREIPAAEVKAAHIARWDPARVLAECEAKRKAVAEYGAVVESGGADPDNCDSCIQSTARAMLRALAEVYREHPDYRPEWHLPLFSSG